MLSFDELLEQFNTVENQVKVAVSEEFNLNIKDEVFLIESGTVKAYGEKNPKTGGRQTKTFREHDPIGFAEAITSREKLLDFKHSSDITLIKFDGANLRKQVNDSNIFAKSIIKYSIGRIFELKKGNNFAFEDELLYNKNKIWDRVRFAHDDVIYSAGSTSKNMYLIEKGLVQIIATDGKVLANLNKGECFGEAAIIKGRERKYTAKAKSDCSLISIGKPMLEQQIGSESPLVQLSVLLLLKRLELMNNFN